VSLARGLGLVLAVAAALLLVGLGQAPFERAEIYFMDAARAMVERSDYLVPHFQGEPFFDKPALTYWLIAAAYRAFGFTPAAARLVPVLAALGVLLATAWLGRKLFGREVALAAAAVLATTLAFVAFGRIAMSDMPLTLFTTLAVALAVDALDDRPKPHALPLLGLVLGLGFLAKGPVALVMAGIPIGLLAWSRGWGRGLQNVPGLLAAAALFAVFGLGWFAVLYARLGAGPLAYFFLRENLERFAGEAYDVGRPFWYYPPAFLLAGLPWSLFVPLALARARRGGASALLAAWTGLALVPLSLSRGKLDYYLLPLYPALALLVARLLVALPWRAVERAWVRGVLAIAALCFAGLATLPSRFDSAWLPSPAACSLLVAVSAAAAAASLVVAWNPGPWRVVAGLGGATAAVGLVLAGFFLPAFRASQPNRALAADVARELRYRPEARIVACADPSRVERDLLFETRAVVERRCDLWNVAPARAPFLFLLSPEERASLGALPTLREVSRYRYLSAATLTVSGFLSPPEAGLVVLAANYPTDDPVAEEKRKKDRKRELREAGELP
jgi:4-amino-4-deoxy-L-arabinose transferase-like glycosyltransferase